jgi:hypothetical protein
MKSVPAPPFDEAEHVRKPPGIPKCCDRLIRINDILCTGHLLVVDPYFGAFEGETSRRMWETSFSGWAMDVSAEQGPGEGKWYRKTELTTEVLDNVPCIVKDMVALFEVAVCVEPDALVLQKVDDKQTKVTHFGGLQVKEIHRTWVRKLLGKGLTWHMLEGSVTMPLLVGMGGHVRGLVMPIGGSMRNGLRSFGA